MQKYFWQVLVFITSAMIGLSPASATSANVDINIGVPGLYQSPPPVYLQPQRVIVHQQPIVVHQRPVYVRDNRYWDCKNHNCKHKKHKKHHHKHHKHDDDDDD